ncbi:MAG: tRNA (N6-threonylcarbamoyladenosine(37)-N6)-methyltransferase TrmO, partial [Chloroflexota bacterium]
EALDGLEGFSHIIVIFWMHRTDRTRPLRLKIHPRGDAALPLTGLLATRSPHHPNPLGMTAVRLLGRKENILRVKGLDALDGTPVIDIKPYLPGGDSPRGARTPPWVKRR